MKKKNWMYYWLLLAGLYNLLWGGYAVLAPRHFFDLINIKQPEYIEFWQCIGMIVGVYGIGYIIAAFNPLRHWPIILVGLLGKIFGPIGFIGALIQGSIPSQFGYTIITNDLIWWIPFTLILLAAKKKMSKLEQICVAEEDFSQFDDRKRARFINSLSGFKSSNLVGTIDEEGNTNLSIISSAFHLGANPALIGFIIRPDVSPRHTLDNLRNKKVCTMNHVNTKIYQEAHQTSARYPKEVSEFSACQLTEEFKHEFIAPFVKEAHIQLALELVREEKLPENGTHLMICKIKAAYLPKDCLLEDGLVDIEKAETICVSGLDRYHTTENIGRLSYAKPDKSLSFVE